MLQPDQSEWLTKMAPLVDEYWKYLTVFERKFMEDIIEKHKQYGLNLNLSPKQWEIISQISEKVGL